jgi:gliding motility-associated-like protein
MGAQRIHLFLSLMVGFLLTFEGEAQVTFDLEVQVVMDTVLYDGYQGAEDFIAEGSRRYKLYAVLPSPDAIMLGPAADSDSDPAIPGFGFDAACGCYNWESIFVPDGYNSGSSINAGFYALAPELVYDTWWTTHVGTQTPGTTVFQAPGTFPIDFDACSDLVTQGALVVTNADPIHATVQNGRALIGQITTCESFSYQVCVAMQVGTEVTTLCTDGFVEVTDLCVPMLDPQFSVIQEIGCFGDSAIVEVLPNNPLDPFNATVEYSLFQLNETDTVLVQQQVGNPVFSGVEEGNYHVALLDTARTAVLSSNTCRDTTAAFAFVSPDEIVFNATLTQDNICGELDEATICFTAEGGTGDLTTLGTTDFGFLVVPNETDCFGPLSCIGGDGIYVLEVTDETGCTQDTTITISCPEALFFDVSNSEVSCTGYSDASFDASAAGGTGTVTFEVPAVGVLIDFEGGVDYAQDSLPSGTYIFTLVDENGCTLSDTLEIDEPEGLSVDYSVTDVACAGDCNGLIVANIDGGELPYQLSVNDLEGAEVISGQLCPGTYIHTTEDGNACLVMDTLAIVGPDTIQFIYSVSNVPCSGADNGQICLDSLQGGTGPLTPQLVPLPTGALDGNCFNVPAGNYEVLVQDSVGCTSAFFSASVEEPANIEIIPTITPISCTGAGDGVLVVNAVGGSGPLALISPFVFSSLPDTLFSLGADSLNLIVGDTLGCIDSVVVSIPEPEPVELEVLNVVFPECGGDCNGGIEVTLGGGTGSLTLYNGSVSDSTTVVSSGLVNLCADTYALYLTDEEQCVDSVTVTIEEPEPLLFDITVQNVTCTGMDDGVAIIGTFGGSGESAWEFVGGDVDVLNLFEGEYAVTAADTAGCTADSIFIVSADIDTDMAVELFSTPVTCWQTSDGSATAAVTGGQQPIQYVWSDVNAQTTATAIGLAEDVYSVTVTDNIGCTLGFLTTVEPTEDCLFIADALTPNGDGINDRWVVGGLEFFPQSEVQVFNRWGQMLFRSSPGTTWWDGTFNGALLPASDYYYVITVFAGAEPITGTVTLKY